MSVYAPGASGNVASEDLAFMLSSMGADTGIDTKALLELRERFHTVFNDSEVRKSMAAQGNSIWLMEPDATADYFRSEMEKYAEIVRLAKLQPL